MTGPAVELLAPDHHPLLERLWQLYRHDLSEFRGEHGPIGFRGTLPDDAGAFRVDGLDVFLEPSDDRVGYVFRRDGRPAGFALVSGLTADARLMSEFFVLRGARRQGIGHAAAHDVLTRHPGPWQIPFQERNAAAARFWRALAAGVAVDSPREEQRPVPGKPEVPPDTWLYLSVAPPGYRP